METEKITLGNPVLKKIPLKIFDGDKWLIIAKPEIKKIGWWNEVSVRSSQTEPREPSTPSQPQAQNLEQYLTEYKQRLDHARGIGSWVTRQKELVELGKELYDASDQYHSDSLREQAVQVLIDAVGIRRAAVVVENIKIARKIQDKNQKDPTN